MEKPKPSSFSKKAKYQVPFGAISVTEQAKEIMIAAINSNWVSQGQFVQQFERGFAELFGTRHGVAVSSGTDALTLACATLYDLGAQRGDEIILPALTFVATGNAVVHAGFQPVFVDVERETLNINPHQIEKMITPRTKALLPVHLMGKPAEMDMICDIARRHNLYIIEDAAEAHGAVYKERKIGTIGHMACFSLYAAHILSSIEGGIIITDDAQMADVLRSLRNHGMEGKFKANRIGFSAKMHELEAAVGIGNLSIFEQIVAKRRRNLLYLIDKFKTYEDFFITIEEQEHEKLGPHGFPIILKEQLPFTKDEMVLFLDQAGIDSRNLFYSIPTQCAGYQFLGKRLGDFPQAEYCSLNGFHLGVHQDLEMKQLDYIVDAVRQFLKTQGCL